MSTVFFFAQLDFEIACFTLIYDLNGFKSRINSHLLSVGAL